MQKSLSIAIGAVALLVLGVVFWLSLPSRRQFSAASTRAVSPPVVSSAPAAASSLRRLNGRVLALTSARATSRREPSLYGRGLAHPGFYLLDGGVPPALSGRVPRVRRLGVIVIRYRGAQGAAPDARTKAEALAYARSLLPLANTDFAAAVRFGDPGSTTDLGSISRDVLEPAPNYLVFTAKRGEIRGPVDTPTGFWIIKVLR